MACMTRHSSLNWWPDAWLMSRPSLGEIVVRRPALSKAVHPLLLLGREIRRLQQLPPPLPCPPHGHEALPPLDQRVIARAEHVRHPPALEDLGARVLRMLEQPPEERIPRGSARVAEGARLKPRHRLRHDQRGRFPARDRKSTRLNSSHLVISYAVFCLKKKKKK